MPSYCSVIVPVVEVSVCVLAELPLQLYLLLLLWLLMGSIASLWVYGQSSSQLPFPSPKHRHCPHRSFQRSDMFVFGNWFATRHLVALVMFMFANGCSPLLFAHHRSAAGSSSNLPFLQSVLNEPVPIRERGHCSTGWPLSCDMCSHWMSTFLPLGPLVPPWLTLWQCLPQLTQHRRTNPLAQQMTSALLSCCCQWHHCQ